MPVRAKHGDGIRCEKGALAPELADLLKNGRSAARQCGGRAEPWHFPAKQGSRQGKQVLNARVVAGKNVAFPCLPTLCAGEDADRDIPHVNEIVAAFDAERQPATAEGKQHPGHISARQIAGTDNAGWQNHADIQTVLSRLKDQSGCHGLTFSVIAEDLVRRESVWFRDCFRCGLLRDRMDGADVDQPPSAKFPAQIDDVPRTLHIETVCLLSKLQSKEHIEIEVAMDEMDLTSAESKATYEEIREYVFEHTGLKVSHLYIAQVKQKYGIIERENYNKPKSENAKQPQCPLEKEKAITEALQHFGMI